MLINLGQTKVVVPEKLYQVGEKIKVELEILIDEPTLTGYDGLVCAAKHIDLSVSPEADKSYDS